jgi:hypothetical protein
MIYSLNEAYDVRRKFSITVCRKSGGRIEVWTNGHIATRSGLGRTLNVVGPWVAEAAQGRRDDNAALGGIDGGRQSEEEYGSGERLGEHLNNEWMEVCRMAAGSAKDRLCRTCPFRGD